MGSGLDIEKENGKIKEMRKEIRMINELTKGESLSFLELVYLAINVDDLVFEKEEKAFEGYIERLGINNSMEDFSDVSLEETLKNIKTYETRKKKIIFMEVLGVLFSDDIYDDVEKEFAKKVGEELSFTEEEVLRMEQVVLEYFVAYKTMINEVNK